MKLSSISAGQTLLAINFLSCLTTAKFYKHGATFEPDIVLYATAQNISIDCESRYSVIINGSSSGPTIYLKEGFTSWIRYTMTSKTKTLRSIGTDLHNSQRRNQMALHWYHNGLPLQEPSSIMRYILMLQMLERIFIIRM